LCAQKRLRGAALSPAGASYTQQHPGASQGRFAYRNRFHRRAPPLVVRPRQTRYALLMSVGRNCCLVGVALVGTALVACGGGDENMNDVGSGGSPSGGDTGDGGDSSSGGSSSGGSTSGGSDGSGGSATGGGSGAVACEEGTSPGDQCEEVDATCEAPTSCCVCVTFPAVGCGNLWSCAIPENSPAHCPEAAPTIGSECDSNGSGMCQYCLEAGPLFLFCATEPQNGTSVWIETEGLSCNN